MTFPILCVGIVLWVLILLVALIIVAVLSVDTRDRENGYMTSLVVCTFVIAVLTTILMAQHGGDLGQQKANSNNKINLLTGRTAKRVHINKEALDYSFKWSVQIAQ